MSRRVAVVTDIHANVPALEAARRRIDELAVDEVYCGGDLVGYGPRPNEVTGSTARRMWLWPVAILLSLPIGG